MDYVKDVPGKWDEVVESFGVKVFIDPRALLHIVGSTMDFVDDHVCALPSDCFGAADAFRCRCGPSSCSTTRTARASAAAASRSMCDGLHFSPGIQVEQRCSSYNTKTE
jgi:hypothetical protein